MRVAESPWREAMHRMEIGSVAGVWVFYPCGVERKDRVENWVHGKNDRFTVLVDAKNDRIENFVVAINDEFMISYAPKG